MLSHHKALVTGASKGLGHALTTALASAGCSTIAVARSTALLRQNSDALPVLHTAQSHQFVPLDLTDIRQLHTLEPHLQNCTILVNCAGVTNHSLLAHTPTEEIVATVNLNLLAPIILSKMAFKPLLKSSKTLKNTPSRTQVPCILNVSSVLSLEPHLVPGTAVYSAAKNGLNTFTKSLALELRDRVRANALLPGLIGATDMGRSAALDAPSVDINVVVAQAMRIIQDDTINGQLISITR